MSPNVYYINKVPITTDKGYKLSIDENYNVSAKEVSWRETMVAFLQGIPLLRRLVSPRAEDVITQAIFLKSLAGKYGTGAACAVSDRYHSYFAKIGDTSGNSRAIQPLYTHKIKEIVSFAQRIESRYPAVNPGRIREALAYRAAHPTLRRILTEKEYVAIRIYTGASYTAINNALRSNDPIKMAQWQDLVNDAKQGLEKLAQHGYSRKGLVFRGTSLSKDNKFVSLDDYQEGKTVMDKGFVSTTEDKATAKFFLNVSETKTLLQTIFCLKSTDDKLLMHIFAGKSGAKVTALSEYNHEKEVLIKPSTQFSVLFNAFDAKTNVYKVVMSEASLPATHGTKGYANALTDAPAKKQATSETRPLPWLDLA